MKKHHTRAIGASLLKHQAMIAAVVERLEQIAAEGKADAVKARELLDEHRKKR